MTIASHLINLPYNSKIHELLIKTDKTVISAVNGPAPGWGTTSIALSDLVYSVPEAIFFTPFVQWGICAEGCSSVTFGRIMGRAKASALILAGQRFTAAEMESAGLITKILPKEEFLESVLKIARDMAKLPPNSLRLNKNILMSAGGYREELLAANRKEMVCLAEQARRHESLDAVAAFAKATEARKKAKAAKATKL
jgi:peroxisomal 3,2-trans-enoyl-CoA isomerase